MSKFVPYHRESREEAKKITAGMRMSKDKYEAITSYVKQYFYYDYIRAIAIPKRNALPNINYCWKNKRGICQDIAAMTVGMLRSVGVDAYFCVGVADGQYHAWVEAIINRKKYIFDHPNTAKVYKLEKRYY